MVTRQASLRVSVVDEFIDQVQREIELQGVSLSELARRAGCGRPYLYRVLTRQQSPSLEWAEKVADALGLEFTLQKSANP